MDLEKLDNAVKELEKQSTELKNLSSVYSEIAKLKQDILENIRLLKENNKELATISSEVEKHLEESRKKIDEIYRDNKAFQKELDTSIVSRLDKHKSDIQVDIRNEGTQIQRSFATTLNFNFNQMESQIKDAFERQTKQLSILKILIFILMFVIAGLIIGQILIK